MKEKSINIFLAFVLILTCHWAFSNSQTGRNQTSIQQQEDDRRQEDEGKSEETKVIDEDKINASDKDHKGDETVVNDQEGSSGGGAPLPVNEEDQEDSEEEGSVSKYNFIFYLLYKFKYDTAP